MSKNSTALERAKIDIERLAYAGLDSRAYRLAALKMLQRIVPIDASFFGTADPATLLVTNALFTDDSLENSKLELLHNELLEDDFNKFAWLAVRKPLVASLSTATGNDLTQSARFRNILSVLGFGDEMRAALTLNSFAWGILCLHRELSGSNFTIAETAMLKEVIPHLAKGLRISMLMDMMNASTPPDSPSLVILDDHLSLIGSTPAAERWLDEMMGKSNKSELPFALYAVAARLQALESETHSSSEAQVLVRTESGRWLQLYASRFSDPARHGQIAVILELARTLQIAPVIVQAFDLTRREVEITQLVAHGFSTAEISAQLCISVNTVQDHLKSIFDKVGVRNRRTLVAQIYTQLHHDER